jgi:hypothetical protein
LLNLQGPFRALVGDSVRNIAWYEQHSVVITTWKYSAGANLSPVIDELSSGQDETRPHSNEIVQVHDGTAALPKKRVHFIAAVP